MGQNSKIEWTHHTFNPWWGCMRVSPACDNCYAETFANRFGDFWGAKAEYRTFGDKHWNEPLRWNKKAATAGERHRVFCASMADVFDNRAPEGARSRLWDLIKATPNLDWLLLTKRPQNIVKMLPADWGDGYHNVWLGTTVENQVEANRRIPALSAIPAKVRFLSCEPLLESIDLMGLGYAASGYTECDGHYLHNPIDWVICGGESGAGARPMMPDWAKGLRDQCINGGIAFHFKQWGDWSEAGEKVGKRAAGRLLEDREWNELPAPQGGDDAV